MGKHVLPSTYCPAGQRQDISGDLGQVGTSDLFCSVPDMVSKTCPVWRGCKAHGILKFGPIRRVLV